MVQSGRIRSGTSPRGWGKPMNQDLAITIGRNIPTRVGKTDPRSHSLRNGPEHPHAGGENIRPVQDDGLITGTSPRGWGKLFHQGDEPDYGRNIPTRVGKTTGDRSKASISSEHPHAGGENGLNRIRSSGLRRNIPTRVGKTRAGMRCKKFPSEHPHAGGENFCRYRNR